MTADLYAGVERQLLELCARQLAAGLDAPGWAVAKLAALSPLRRAADVLLGALAGTVDTEVRHAVAEAYDAGRASALEELDALPDEDRRTVAERTPHARAVDRLAAETIDTVTSTTAAFCGPSRMGIGRLLPRSPRRPCSAPRRAARPRSRPCSGSPTGGSPRSGTGPGAAGH
ncbi:phage minor capsid protein [Streptomyces albofaciens]|uniref:phage minor capsid protein n=1 Tax=Streptomyces albofaciens TaxID=66866 RepID=UPI00244DCC4C|nr:phage minor capsid protein [Streptomyces albofaciens]